MIKTVYMYENVYMFVIVKEKMLKDPICPIFLSYLECGIFSLFFMVFLYPLEYYGLVVLYSLGFFP